jgi:hypothetical protein
VTNTQVDLSTVADKKNTGTPICNINVVKMVLSIKRQSRAVTYIKMKFIYIGECRVKKDRENIAKAIRKNFGLKQYSFMYHHTHIIKKNNIYATFPPLELSRPLPCSAFMENTIMKINNGKQYYKYMYVDVTLVL